MARRRPDLVLEPRAPDALVFRAALAAPGTGRKAWTQDSEGQGVLSIEIPMSDADDLGGRLALLRDKVFRVAIILEDALTTVTLPSE